MKTGAKCQLRKVSISFSVTRFNHHGEGRPAEKVLDLPAAGREIHPSFRFDLWVQFFHTFCRITVQPKIPLIFFSKCNI
jgi:hypothetical protein